MQRKENPVGPVCFEGHVILALLLLSVSWSDQSLEFATLLADLENRSGNCCGQHRDRQAQ